MEARKPSESAIAAAMMRAAHLILDDDPKILQDNLAWKLSGVTEDKAVIPVLNAFYEEMAGRYTNGASRPDVLCVLLAG